MATAAAAAETGARAGGRSHPEAGMVAAAGGSHRTPVKLCVTNVYNSTSSEIASLETTNTIGDLKRLLQETVSSRPTPNQQRLIFRGKQCEETQQLGHVLRGLDLSGLHNMHLIVSPSAEQPSPPADDSSMDTPSPSPPQRPPQPQPTANSSSRSSGGVPAAAAAAATSGQPERIQLSQTQLGQLQWQYQQALRENEQGLEVQPLPTAGAAAASTGGTATTSRRPERIQLNPMQLGQLQWQYQQALTESGQALEAHRQRFDFLSAQSRALTQGQAQATPTTATARRRTAHGQHQHQQLQQHPQPNEQEVSVRAATRALGGNMPGPAGGGGVRDITGPPPVGHVPDAGLGEDGEAGRGNLVDPPARAPDIGREARGYFKMVVQCFVVTLVFGIEADGWLLGMLAFGGFMAFLFRTGLLKEMLGSGREGGGLWKMLCTGATVITEDGGLLMDARFFFSAFFFSLFPKWQPVRSPEAIAAEAAAQAQARDAQAQAAAVRAGLRAQAYEAAQEASAAVEDAGEATAEQAQQSNATRSEQAAEPVPERELAGATDEVQGERERGGAAGEAASNTMPAEQRERAADVNPALPD